jgi:DNA-binding response OmpR family regulator
VASPERATTILVVEDDRDLRAFYRAVLSGAGYDVIAVDDGITALRLIETRAPDLVILDLVLPRLGGRDVLRELRASDESRRIPVIVVTGDDVSDLTDEEARCVIQKPVTAPTLVAAIQQCLRR